MNRDDKIRKMRKYVFSNCFRSDVTFGVMPDSQILKQPFKE